MGSKFFDSFWGCFSLIRRLHFSIIRTLSPTESVVVGETACQKQDESYIQIIFLESKGVNEESQI